MKTTLEKNDSHTKNSSNSSTKPKKKYKKKTPEERKKLGPRLFKNGKVKKGMYDENGRRRSNYQKKPKSKVVVVDGVIRKREKVEKDLDEGKQYEWKTDFYVLAYEGARDGKTDNQIAISLGVDKETLMDWRIAKPALERGIQKGREINSGKVNFQDYVYQQLPPNLKEIWDSISECENKYNAVERIEAILKKKGKEVRQHLFIHALTVMNFNLNKALKSVNVPKSRFDYWMQTDPDFVKLFDAIQFHKKNFLEDALMKLIKQGDSKAIIFANKTLNKDRGYTERMDVHHTHDHSHNHIHQHGVLQIEDLDLSLEAKREILAAIRKKNQSVLQEQGLLEDKTHAADTKIQSTVSEDEIVVEPVSVRRE